MNVILLDKVENLGAIGDLVSVKAGYGRNFLIPSGKAALATHDNIKEFEVQRANLEKKAAEELSAAKARAELVQGMELIIRPTLDPRANFSVLWVRLILRKHLQK